MNISWLTLSFLNFWGFLNMKVSSSFFDHNAHLLKESRSITVFQVFFPSLSSLMIVIDYWFLSPPFQILLFPDWMATL